MLRVLLLVYLNLFQNNNTKQIFLLFHFVPNVQTRKVSCRMLRNQLHVKLLPIAVIKLKKTHKNLSRIHGVTFDKKLNSMKVIFKESSISV